MKSPPKKLIEVVLPLAEINAASVREKSICSTWCAATLQELGVLPRFRNILVHDGFKSYATLECAHALCNAHLLRELTFQAEFRQQDWAKAMIGLLWEVQTFCIMRSHLSTLKKQGGELLPFTGSNLQWG